MYKSEVLKKIIKDIYNINKSALEIIKHKGNITVRLNYDLAVKYREYYGYIYWWGMDIKNNNHKEYLQTFKQLLQIKKFLKSINR